MGKHNFYITMPQFMHCILISIYIAKCYSNKLEIIKQHVPEDCSKTAELGDDIEVHYTGSFKASGEIFDTSKRGNVPLAFKLGAGKVIPGMDQGLEGMCIGEQRKLIIPPHLAYGSRGHPPAIPPDSTLVFETEMVSIRKPEFDAQAAIQNFFKQFSIFLFPVGGLVIVYFMYDKYNKTEGTSKKLSKQERKAMERKSGRKKKH